MAQHATQGDPQDVLRTIDRFAGEVRWPMNAGPDKGLLVEETAPPASNAPVMQTR